MQKKSYLANLWQGIVTSWKGLSLSLRHARQAIDRRKPFFVDDTRYFQQKTGIVTLQYPSELLPVPDIGRYQLFNEIEDCIVCDKCAKVCPVDCIEIEAIKATEQIGTTSDGSPIRLYAAKFDIDMAKCCYCGLCTTVCPTECLTMTKEFNYSALQVQDMLYHFSNLSEEEAQAKIKLWEQFQLEKIQAKSPKSQVIEDASESRKDSTPIFKPTMKPKMKTLPLQKNENEEENTPKEDTKNSEDTPKTFKPKMKTIIKPKSNHSTDNENN